MVLCGWDYSFIGMEQPQGVSLHNTSATLSTGLLQSSLKTSIESQKSASEVRRMEVFYIVDIITYK